MNFFPKNKKHGPLIRLSGVPRIIADLHWLPIQIISALTKRLLVKIKSYSLANPRQLLPDLHIDNACAANASFGHQ